MYFCASAEKECESFEVSLAELKVWDAQMGALAAADGDGCSPEEVVHTSLSKRRVGESV